MSGVLHELRQHVAMSSADWSQTRSDAWIYGVIVGWDLGPDDDPVFDEPAMPDIAARFNLTDEQVTELRRLHDEFEALLRRGDERPPANQHTNTAIPFDSRKAAPMPGPNPSRVFTVDDLENLLKPTEHGQYAEKGYNDDFNDGVRAVIDLFEDHLPSPLIHGEQWTLTLRREGEA
ncbi:hypothetical protein [Curtobacterium sp. MCSS17_016]|uniref:hypothetical protein n=1 Tax=Curtobacterium sp. MCSS17_016 TaxID=2175644 RepID=UPI000DAA3CB9|nr:hypothetical protein [Curtobacterium sp. MCSS17_016]WIE81388.1 hypothetical protein DEJ19_019325 [Curtobacterium sp. MCSS17_016]